jgi:hypothetical protein
MRGRRPSRKAAIAAAAALAVVLGAGAAALVAASGDDNDAPVASATTRTSPTSTAPGTSGDTTTSTTATEGSSSTTETAPSESETSTAPNTSPAEPPSSRGDNGAKHRVVQVPPRRVFSGRGSTWLGTIELSKPAVVRWSSRGKLSIRFGREQFGVVAPSRSGQLTAPPDRFELVRVISNSSWRIEITPQG